MSDQLPCPHCGAMQKDLWDFDWSTTEVIIAECGECEKPIDIVRHVSVTYEIRKPTQRTCQAEDQGGWPCGSIPVVFQLTPEEVKKNDGRQMYFCKDHRTNKFVWTEPESEPIPEGE